MMENPCSAHGTAKMALIKGDNRHIDSPAMMACIACMDDGATPGGTWAEVIETEDAYCCKKCGALIWDVALHDDFHEVPAGRRAGVQSRYLFVAMFPNLMARNKQEVPKDG